MFGVFVKFITGILISTSFLFLMQWFQKSIVTALLKQNFHFTYKCERYLVIKKIVCWYRLFEALHERFTSGGLGNAWNGGCFTASQRPELRLFATLAAAGWWHEHFLSKTKIFFILTHYAVHFLEFLVHHRYLFYCIWPLVTFIILTLHKFY